MSVQTITLTDELEEYLWSKTDREPEDLAALREETLSNPRHRMQISPLQGQFMGVMVKALGVKRILEVGVFTGYSSLAMALALPDDGELIALDVSEEWTALARKYWKIAGVDDKVTLVIAPAIETMDSLIDEGQEGSFDLIFIDADKPNYTNYWERGLTLLRRGGLMMVDNVLFLGTVAPSYTQERLEEFFADRPAEWRDELIGNTYAARAFNDYIQNDDRVDLSTIPVGDGITLAVKK